MLKNKFKISLIVLCVVGLGGGLAISYYKYHVKRFVKSNSLLYGVAQKVASFKHEFSGLSPEAEASETGSDRPTQVRKNWTLVFDAAQSLGTYQRFWGNLGYESYKNGISSGPNRQLFEMIAETNRTNAGSFRYVRAHNLFSDGKPPYGEGCISVSLDASGKVVCDWKLADQIFDAIIANGLRPIVELGFMPDAMASIPSRRQKWGRGNISPPKDYAQWQSLVFQTVRHFSERYGEDEVRRWYFEVWNEPDLAHLFWVKEKGSKNRGDLQKYLKLYDHAVYGAKKALPSIRIGGPASAGGYLDGLLEHTVIGKSFAGEISAPRIDFVSSHSYGFISEKNRRGMNIFKAIQWKLGRILKHDHREVRRSAKQMPFLLTETGFGKKKGAFQNDRFMAAWMAKFVTMNFHLGDDLGQQYQPVETVLWANSQVVKDFAPHRGIAASLKTSAGRRVFKRPVYNAIEAMGYLSSERIACLGDGKFGDAVYGLATKDEDNSVEVLAYHLNERDENSVTPDSFDVDIHVQNLPFKRCLVNYYVIDQTHANVYSAWRRMGAPKKLSKQQARQLSAADDLVLARTPWLEGEDNSFNHKLRLQSNSVALFVLKNHET
jgi:xylan 1,4-beta-xylosidase